MNECAFCDIINKKRNTEIIFDTPNFFVMVNEHRVARKGLPLCLIVAKNHLTSVDTFDLEMCSDYMKTVVKISKLYKQTYHSKGTRAWFKSGAASWSYPHFHGHVMAVDGFLDYPMHTLKLAQHIIEDFILGKKRRKRLDSVKLKRLADELRDNLHPEILDSVL